MAARRSRTGCLTCRKRKLKCDEVQPVCTHCSKAQRTCQLSSGVTFRHEQNASMNGSSDSLKTFYGYKDTFSDDHVWLDIPEQVTFINVTDPYSETDPALPTLDHDSMDQIPNMDALEEFTTAETRAETPMAPFSNVTNGLEALSAAASVDSYLYMPLASPVAAHTPLQLPSAISSPTQTHSASNNSVSTGRAIPSPMASRLDDSPIDPNLDGRPRNRDQLPVNHMSPPESDRELAFLLRHYSEVLGYGMDLFDSGRFFAFHVPVRAVSCPLLKYAACAYAAKQLFRVKGSKAVHGATSQQASMEIWPKAGKADWEWVGAKYYDKALTLLLEELGKQQNEGNDVVHIVKARPKTSDDVLAAAAILCEYEAMDVAGAWSRHLNGTKTLLDLAEIGMRPAGDTPRDSSNGTKLFAGAKKAIFWNFARQDYASAFITDCQTRLDVNNYQMWQAAGLDLDEYGVLQPNEDPERGYDDNHSREDMAANGLILLLSKLNNFITAGEKLYPSPGEQLSMAQDIGFSQNLLLGRWNILREELDTWRHNLPKTFKPCARVPHPVFSELWYSIPMAASAIQNYHFARILLMINKPHESTAGRSSVLLRMKSYQSITAEMTFHAREIVSIALARPEASVRIFSIQPLFVSGQCLSEQKERQIVVDLLRGIENDLGWASSYRVEQLLQEWGEEFVFDKAASRS